MLERDASTMIDLRTRSREFGHRLRRREGVVEPGRALAVLLRLRRRLQEQRVQRVPEAVGAPPVADAAEHGLLLQRPRAGLRPVQVYAARDLRVAVAVVVRRRRRGALGHHGRHDRQE